MTHPYCVVQISNISQCSTMVFVCYFVRLWNKIFTTIYTKQTPQRIYTEFAVSVRDTVSHVATIVSVTTVITNTVITTILGHGHNVFTVIVPKTVTNTAQGH